MRFILSNKRLVISLFWLVNLGVLFFLALTWMVPALHTYWRKLAGATGNVAVLALATSLLPGIMKRFSLTGWWSQLRILLMAFRRQIGVAMFMFSFYHWVWMRVMPAIKYEKSLLTLSLFEIVGMVALVISGLLFFTSNDWSIQIMGKYWRVLHKLVYALPWLVLLHLVLSGRAGKSVVILYVVGFLELASFSVASGRKDMMGRAK